MATIVKRMNVKDCGGWLELWIEVDGERDLYASRETPADMLGLLRDRQLAGWQVPAELLTRFQPAVAPTLQ